MVKFVLDNSSHAVKDGMNGKTLEAERWLNTIAAGELRHGTDLD